MSWSDSATTESWIRPLTPAKQKGWYNATYFTGNYEMQKVVAATPGGATDVDPSVANLPFGRFADVYTDLTTLTSRSRRTSRSRFPRSCR